jgi:hypothetical protein
MRGSTVWRHATTGPRLHTLEARPAAERDAVRARKVDERRYEDIYVELRCSQSAARKRVNRGVRAIKDRHVEEAERPMMTPILQLERELVRAAKRQRDENTRDGVPGGSWPANAGSRA